MSLFQRPSARPPKGGGPSAGRPAAPGLLVAMERFTLMTPPAAAPPSPPAPRPLLAVPMPPQSPTNMAPPTCMKTARPSRTTTPSGTGATFTRMMSSALARWFLLVPRPPALVRGWLMALVAPLRTRVVAPAVMLYLQGFPPWRTTRRRRERGSQARATAERACWPCGGGF